MKYQIKLNSVEDVLYFINILEYNDYQAEAIFESYTLDAKSLLGLLGYGVGKVITVMLHGEPDETFCHLMQKYAAAQFSEN